MKWWNYVLLGYTQDRLEVSENGYETKRRQEKTAVNGFDEDEKRNERQKGPTPLQNEKLVDEDVARIIRMVYTPKPDQKFSNSHCATSEAHYPLL